MATKKKVNEKYIMTDITKEIDGVTLHRIKATSDFGDASVIQPAGPRSS